MRGGHKQKKKQGGQPFHSAVNQQTLQILSNPLSIADAQGNRRDFSCELALR
jgi:hypothetical protein